MKKNYEFLSIIILFSMIMFLTNCKKDNYNSSICIQNVIGYVQKGPFINGSSVTVYDLQSDLTPTGKSYNTQITDNKGTFKLSNISLSSNYVSLRSDGFYFNEISGKQSSAQITLYTLSDITGKDELNINILTHLEKSRVEYLIKNGMTFNDAKTQAQKEILAIFNIEKSDIKTSENLNISESGDDNGILLAVSAILQGYRSESELTELLSNISNDISTDGTLNSDTLGSDLINHAIFLDTVSIKNNLTKRYSDIGAAANIPVFGNYISNFISKTKFKITGSIIDYPENGIYGINLLSLNDTIFAQSDLSLAANLPKGTSLKIVITALDEGGYWSYFGGTENNWSISPFTGNSQTFTAINSGTSCDLHMASFSSGRFLIEYYEINFKTPTRRKIIII
jgi:hypothetical protein